MKDKSTEESDASIKQYIKDVRERGSRTEESIMQLLIDLGFTTDKIKNLMK